MVTNPIYINVGLTNHFLHDTVQCLFYFYNIEVRFDENIGGRAKCFIARIAEKKITGQQM